MNLLLNRDQSFNQVFSLIPLKFGSGVIFTVHAELELTQEESFLMNRYNLKESVLVGGSILEELKRFIWPSAVVAFVAQIIFTVLWGFWQPLPLLAVTFFSMLAANFYVLREYVLVSQLLDGGRKFRCDSIVELVQKEFWIQGQCEYLRQVVESAKTWDDRETLEVKPLDKERARRAIVGMR